MNNSNKAKSYKIYKIYSKLRLANAFLKSVRLEIRTESGSEFHNFPFISFLKLINKSNLFLL